MPSARIPILTLGFSLKPATEFNQGVFSNPNVTNDIYFDTPQGGGNICNTCVVALGGGMYDIYANNPPAKPGTPTTNHPEKVMAQTTYAPPILGNGGSVGVPLNLNPAELGMGVTTSTITAPGTAGLKLSVQCHMPKDGKVDLVALVGGDNGPHPLLTDVGNGDMAACQP